MYFVCWNYVMAKTSSISGVFFRYYIGVLDKQTMQMDVHSAQLFNMRPVVPGLTRELFSSVYWLLY